MIFEGGLGLGKNAVIFDLIDRTWIPRCLQPSVHSKTASSTMLSMGLVNDFFENPGILFCPGWLCIFVYTCTYACAYIYIYIGIHIHIHIHT